MKWKVLDSVPTVIAETETNELNKKMAIYLLQLTNGLKRGASMI
jgi:hypothetical protein